MKIDDFSDNSANTIFIQKTYGKLLLTFEFMMVRALQLDMLAGNFYGQVVCLVVGMVFIKLAHLATQSGIGKAAQIEYAIKQKNRIRDDHQAKIARILRRAATARVVAQTSIFWSALKAIIAADLQVRSIVKSVLCTVTDTLTPKLFRARLPPARERRRVIDPARWLRGRAKSPTSLAGINF
ncbi:hypothetical protein SBP18_03200 [Rhodoferax ferrireducens]|uniref:hypothetical protein n=1 Tax=Rhodoferax ferrireducens TaxID=192843 RepID=UPI00298DB4D5|nr:hypothetical protein [Rhodoferax ferrireducens]WPC67526.1 hypothetical protein SBP18_03200 [Rhodoferax ferrireducens]